MTHGDVDVGMHRTAMVHLGRMVDGRVMGGTADGGMGCRDRGMGGDCDCRRNDPEIERFKDRQMATLLPHGQAPG
jgi:hypothetical protein